MAILVKRLASMANENVGAGVDRSVCKGAREVGGLGQLALGLGRDEACVAIFMPATSERIWRAIQDGKAANAAGQGAA